MTLNRTIDLLSRADKVTESNKREKKKGLKNGVDVDDNNDF